MRQVFQDANNLAWLLKWCRLLTRILLIGIISAVGLCVAGWLLLQTYGGKIMTAELDKLQARTGLDMSLGNLDVTFLPLPALAISDFRVKSGDIELLVPWAFIRPAFLKMIEGKFLPAELTFQRPLLKINVTSEKIAAFLENLEKGEETRPTASAFDWRDLLDPDCKIHLAQFDIRALGENREGFFVSNMSADVALVDRRRLSGSISVGRIGARNSATRRFALRHASLEGEIDLENFSGGDNSVYFHSGVLLSDIFGNGTVEINYKSHNGQSDAGILLKGDLLLEKAAEPLSVAANLVYYGNTRKLEIGKMDWRLGADSGVLSASASLPEKLRDFTIAGEFGAHRLSLTQWLGFARNLAPGLQLSLDNIYDVNLEFSLDAGELKVPHIVASCNGSVFKGRGGIESFARPVVFLDLETEKTNLGLALEESVGVSPLEPWYGFAPLTPMPGEPLQAGETGIGYDINIGAKTLLYGPLSLQDAKVRIYPGKIENGLEDVIISGAASLYGGKIKGECVLGGPTTLPMTIEGEATNVKGAALEKDLPAWPFKGGIFQASSKVVSQGKELRVFLANLKGNVKVSAVNPALDTFAMEKLDGNVTLKGGEISKGNVVFDGDWDFAATARELAARSTLSGKISFGFAGASFKNLGWKGNFDARKPLGILPAGFAVKASGQASLNTAKNEISISGGNFSTEGLALKGGMTLDYKKFSGQGNLGTVKLETAKLLSRFGFRNVEVNQEWLPASAESQIQFSADSLKFEKLRLATGKNNVTGSLEYALESAKPDFKFDLLVNQILLPSPGKSQSTKPWDFSFLNKFNANGVLGITTLEGWQARLSAIRLPLRLRNGVLSIADGAAKFYGGTVKLAGKVDFGKTLALDLKASARSINLEQAAADQNIKIKIRGTGFVNANLAASGNTSQQLAATLTGVCDFLASNGAWQTLDKGGNVKGKPTQFTKIQASAKVEKGRFTTRDFILNGPDLNIDGAGYLNLPKRDLDYTLNVNMKGVPDFPLYIYGPFNQPKTRVGAGRLVLNALGSVATGLGNLLGGIGDGFAKIFK